VLAPALDVITESGAGGLSLGEVARRMGLQTPSLYQYFASKNALYDALFARGWQIVYDELAPYELAMQTDDPSATFTAATTAFVRWSVDNPGYAQLMFWRPVPGFVPSEAAYAPAIGAMGRLHAGLQALVDRDVLAPTAADAAAMDLFTTLFSGVISQQLANEPGASYEHGTFTALVPTLIDMFFDRYRSRP